MKRQIANPKTFFVILAAFMLLAVQSLTYGQMVSIDPGYDRFSNRRRAVDP